MKRLFPLALLVTGLFLTGRGLGADWPQYRYDASRRAASPERLPTMLHLQWVRHLGAPRPAFPAEVRLRFDRSYEPVVLGKTMFVPSMVTDSVTALDTDTGAQRWQFFAEGPVRFAPVAAEGSVYFISDDGHLYCVDATDGQLRWKFRELPPGKNNRKLMGSGRLISLWPARGGPVLNDGVLYFGAGLWSGYGVSIYALDAKSGRVLWSNADSNRIPKANMDHGTAYFAGLTPQGYLAVVNEKLAVPCGPQLPAFLDLKTGTLETYSMGWGGQNGLPKGTWFVAGTRNYLSNSGDLYDIARLNDERFAAKSEGPAGGPDFKHMLYPGGFTRVRIDPTNQKDLGAFNEPVFDGDVMYDNDRGIVAYDLAEGKLQERRKVPVPEYRRDDTYPDKWKADFRELWRLSSPLKVHIKAAGHLYVGGAGTVGAVRIPERDAAPRLDWQATIEGTPHRMLAADQRLFVVTREGTIRAFGGQQNGAPVVYTEPAAPAPSADEWTKTAADILQTTTVRDGYALVLGIGTGRLAEELLRQSSLDVIAIDQDAGKVAALRQRLCRAGLYGRRASAHVGDPLSYPLSPYLASLIVSENWAGVTASAPRKSLVEAILHPLRPYGGTACVSVPASEREPLVQEVADRRIAGITARPVGDWVVVSRVGPLPDAANWSHPEADAANTGASEERFLKAPLDLLWFDTPARWIRTPGATLVRVSAGRMLIQAEKLQAFDVFTGRRMWETALPFPHTVHDQLVALEDAIYVAGGRICLVLDPTTGRKTRQIDLPAELTGAWANLRAWQGYLVAQSGNHLLCVDRHSGRLLWTCPCGQPSLSVAVGGGRVLCAELISKKPGEGGTGEAKTRALDIATGKPLWEIAGGSEVRYSAALDLVVLSSGIYRAKDGSLLAPLPQGVSDSKGKKQPASTLKPLLVIGDKLLFGTAESYFVYDLQTGTRSEDKMTWTRRGCTTPRASSHFVTTRYRGNAACIDLATRDIISLWNVRAACSNNLFPADGVLNVPSLSGGCTCNYLPVSQAYVPAAVIEREKAQ